MHPATLVFIRQIARLIKGFGTALDEWANALERARGDSERT